MCQAPRDGGIEELDELELTVKLRWPRFIPQRSDIQRSGILLPDATQHSHLWELLVTIYKS